MTASFVPGLELSRAFFEEVVRPRVEAAVRPERYAACLVGTGSEVLGLDTARSMDHDWGPRVVLVVDASDQDLLRDALQELPPRFRGHSLDFGARAGGSPWVQPVDAVTVDRLFTAWIGFNPLATVSVLDWLSAPTNGLLMLTAGGVFHDGPGEVTAAREAISWYPTEVWTWLLGCQWRRISQEHAFVGRAAEEGDELGSRILASRLARDCVRLAFLVERRYAPYQKWLVKALDWLRCARDLRASLDAATTTGKARIRQEALAEAYRLLAIATNALELAPAVDVSPRGYHSRPYVVGPATELSEALLSSVEDPTLRRLRPHGGIDQLFDANDGAFQEARTLYRALLAGDDA